MDATHPDPGPPANPIEIWKRTRWSREPAELRRQIARVFGVPLWLVVPGEFIARDAEARTRSRKRMRRNRRGRNPRA